jgi:primosomal protein N' (replication factor Y)
MVSLTGPAASLRQLLAAADLPPGTDVLGPVPARDSDEERLVLRAARPDARRLVTAVRAAAGVRSAHKDAGRVRVQVDPLEIA